MRDVSLSKSFGGDIPVKFWRRRKTGAENKTEKSRKAAKLSIGSRQVG